MTEAPSAEAVLVNLGLSAVVVAALLLVTLAVAVRVRGGRHDGIDSVWGLGFAVVAVTTLALSDGHGDPGRRWLVTALTVLWGARLAWHIHRRNRAAPEDPRYQRILAKAPGNRGWYAVRMVYLPQGALIWLVSLPVQLAAYGRGDTLFGRTEVAGWLGSTGGLGLVGWLGVLCWLVGFVFEAVGDAQLARFRADPANTGKVMDRGLWHYTRHPNYFGDACVWWGLTLLALHHVAGLAGLVSASVMTLLLTRGSGARLLESTIGERRPGYAEYVARTSGFLPLPPRRNGLS